jgi:hypothetical protein
VTPQEAFDELCAYTLQRGDAAFIHQHVVDAFAAQQADENTKSIKITFALVGLYLLIEKQWTGKQAQRAHMQMGRRKHVWPTFPLPRERGATTPMEVLAAPAGVERDAAIHRWCREVWAAYAESHDAVGALLREHGIL